MAFSADTVERVLAVARKSPENYRYFFERVSSPDWLEPLEQRGLFTGPPAMEVAGGYISAPTWPPSQYLARVASRAPEAVLRISLELDTDNERVHEDLAEAAVAMPGHLAAAWALHETAWLRDRGRLYFLLPDRLAQLVIYLARSGQWDAALRLAVELFRPIGVERESTGPWDVRTAVTRVSSWQYHQLLDKALPVVLEANPEATLQAVVGLLTDSIELARSGDDELDADYSDVWRPRVASDDFDDQEPEHALVSVLRDLAVVSRERGFVADDRLVELLSGNGVVLQRIAAYALAHGPDPDLRPVREFLLDPEALRSEHPSPEYQALLERAGPLLAAEDRDRLAAWIEAGPDIDAFVRRVREYAGTEPTSAETQEYVDTWRARRFRLLRNALSTEQRLEYDRLVERVGEQRFSVPYEVTTWVGPTSPLTLDELRELDDDEIIDFLTVWEEPGGRFGPAPSLEGLARALSELAEREPERVSGLGARLQDLHAHYVYWTLIGLSSAVRNEKEVVWAPVLELIEWLTTQEFRPAGAEADREDELTVLGWARKEAAGLIDAGLRSTRCPIPRHGRDVVWEVLRQLAEDPDPLPEREQRQDGSGLDPATLALNSTRGRAIRAVVAYGLWIRRTSNTDTGANASFALMPEAQVLLERHLDPDYESSAAVRSVFGQFLPQLTYLDASWVRLNASRIFPSDPRLEHLHEAAWAAYVVFARPYNDLLEILRSEYELAIETLGVQRAGVRWIGSSESPDERMACHLMAFYWRGRLSLDENDLVSRFFGNAPARLRAHALEFLGRSVRDCNQLDEDVQERLLRLWEVRLNCGLRSLDDEMHEELRAFSWWFSAASLPLDWRLEQLGHLLAAGVIPAPQFLIFEALGEAANEAPTSAVRLVSRYLRGIEEPWAISGHTDELKVILGAALQAEDPDARNEALRTVHWLGARGYRQFRVMLAASEGS